jgi:hypothetical protein
MPELTFKSVPGSWKGNDYKSVSMTSVSVGTENPCALVFMTHMNADFDGAPNCYGPEDKQPLDSLKNAGRYAKNGYYGLVAVGPNEVLDWNPKKLIKDAYKLQLDERYPDYATYPAPNGKTETGRCPVVQQSGPFKGYFVSGTSRRNTHSKANIFHQEHYLDSSTIPFSALSYDLSQQRVGDADLGFALRHDSYRTASFNMLGGEGHQKGSGDKTGAVGECSYKVFLDIGGTPKKVDETYLHNNFLTTFVVFPGSKMSQLGKIALADNSEDFAVFLALQAEVDARSRGSSGLAAFNKYKEGGRTSKPAGYARVASALHAYGYAPELRGIAKFVASVAQAF